MKTKTIISIISVILTLLILFLINKEKFILSEDRFYNSLVNEYIQKDFYGVVKNKYVDKSEHYYKKVVIANEKGREDVLVLNFERKEFFEFIQIGDTLYKKNNSLQLNLKREKFDTIMYFKFENIRGLENSRILDSIKNKYY